MTTCLNIRHKAFFLVVIVAYFFTGNIAAAADWTDEVTISKIYPSDNNNGVGGVYIETVETMINDGCSTSSPYSLLSTNPVFNNIYALLLQATALNKTVKIYINGCAGSYPEVRRAQINY